jgi:hypothetical protein
MDRPPPATAKTPPETGKAIPPPPPDPSPPPRNNLDLSFIAPDFQGAVIVQGPRLLRSPLLAPYRNEEFFTEASRDFGADPRKVEQVIVLIDPFPGGNVAFLPAGIIRFREPLDGAAVLTKALEDVQPVTFAGKTYFNSKSKKLAQVPISGFVPDGRTILVAPEPTLRKMLVADSGRSPLRDRLPRLDLNSDVVMLFTPEGKVRLAATELLSKAKGDVPPRLARIDRLPEQLQALTLSLNLSGDPLLRLDLDSPDAASAATVHELVTAGHDLLKQFFPELRKGLEGQLPPDLARPVGTVLDDLVAGVRIRKETDRVTVSLSTPKGLGELARSLAPMLEALAAAPTKPPPPPGPRDIREQAVEWVRANNSFGPDSQVVPTLAKDLQDRIGPNQGYILILGSGAVKSKKATALAGWNGALFVFELTDAQVRALNLPDLGRITQNIPAAPDAGRGDAVATLTAVRITDAAALDSARKLTGTLSYKPTGKVTGFVWVRVRLWCMGGSLRGAEAYQRIGTALPAGGEYPLALPSLAEAGLKHTGPLMAFVELTSYDNPDRRGKPLVVSNPLMVLLDVAPSKDGK